MVLFNTKKHGVVQHLQTCNSPAKYCPRGHVLHASHVPGIAPPQPTTYCPAVHTASHDLHVPPTCAEHPTEYSLGEHGVHASHVPALIPPHPAEPRQLTCQQLLLPAWC